MIKQLLHRKKKPKKLGTLYNYEGYMGAFPMEVCVASKTDDITLEDAQHTVAREAHENGYGFYRQLGPNEDGVVFYDYGSYHNFYVFVPDDAKDKYNFTEESK